MASATKLTKKVPIPVPPVITQYRDEDDGVSLRLTQKEAVVLKALMRRVGGEPYTSVRVQTGAIDDALTDVGVKSLTYAESRSLIDSDNHAEKDSIALLDKLMQQPKNLYAGVIKHNYLEDMKQAAEQQQKANEAAQGRVVGMHPALGAAYGSGGLSAGAAIQNCLDKIPEAIVQSSEGFGSKYNEYSKY